MTEGPYTRFYCCPKCERLLDKDDVTEAPCRDCGKCPICAPTDGGMGNSDQCEECAGGANGVHSAPADDLIRAADEACCEICRDGGQCDESAAADAALWALED